MNWQDKYLKFLFYIAAAGGSWVFAYRIYHHNLDRFETILITIVFAIGCAVSLVQALSALL